MLNHEIGTHYIRRYNQKFQPKGKYQYLTDEEGLAVLSQIQIQEKPILYKAALNYYSAVLAKEADFKQLFNQLESYQPNPQKR